MISHDHFAMKNAVESQDASVFNNYKCPVIKFWFWVNSLYFQTIVVHICQTPIEVHFAI